MKIAIFLLAGLALHSQPLTQAPVVIAKCAPEYSEQAKQAKLEGTVLLYIEVDPTGKATNIRVQRNLGLGLDEKAVETVKKWRFSPGKKDGKPITVAATIELNFRLDDTSEPCRTGPAQVEPKTQNGRE